MGLLSIASVALSALVRSVVCDTPLVARAVNASANLFHHRGFHNCKMRIMLVCLIPR